MEAINRRDALKIAAAFTALGTTLSAAQTEHITAIIRISVDTEDVYIPDEAGNLVKTAYKTETRVGKLTREVDPNDPSLDIDGSSIWQHLKREITIRAKNLPKGDSRKPVVIMVHGFMGDPRVKIDPRKQQQSDNPHDFSFHFNSRDQKHWRHTASWPLGLGLDKGDSGAAGLGIAFGWNSQPDIFTSKEKLLATVAFKVAPRLGGATTKKLRNAIAKSAEIVASFGTESGKEGGQALFNQLNAILKDVEPELKQIARDKNIPTYNEVYSRAPKAAPALVTVIRVLADVLPKEQQIDLFCHSLGSRVVIEALVAIAARGQGQGNQALEFQKLLKRVGRVIFVGGAEYSENARTMLKSVNDAKSETSFYNFSSAKDRVLDIFAERLFAREGETQSVIGLRGLEPAKSGLEGVPPEWVASHWFDLELDDDAVAKKWLLDERRVTVAGAHEYGVLNHWYYFTSKDNLKLYSKILRERDEWEIPKLTKELAAFRKAAT